MGWPVPLSNHQILKWTCWKWKKRLRFQFCHGGTPKSSSRRGWSYLDYLVIVETYWNQFETHSVIPHFRMLLGSIPGPPPCPGPYLRSTTSRNPEARGVSNVLYCLYPSYGYLLNGKNDDKPWVLGFFRRPHWETMIQDLKLYTALLLRNMNPWIEQPWRGIWPTKHIKKRTQGTHLKA